MHKLAIAAGLGVAGVIAALVAGVASANEGATLNSSAAATATTVVKQAPAKVSPASEWTPDQVHSGQFAQKNLWDRLGPNELVSSTETSKPNVYEVVLKDAKGASWKILVQLNERNGGKFLSVEQL